MSQHSRLASIFQEWLVLQENVIIPDQWLLYLVYVEVTHVKIEMDGVVQNGSDASLSLWQLQPILALRTTI